MNASVELNTLFEALSHIPATSNNLAARLLDQWQNRFSSQERAVAWSQLDIQKCKSSLDVFHWLLKAHERNEVVFHLENIAHFDLGDISNDMLQTLAKRISMDAAHEVGEKWKNCVFQMYLSIGTALNNREDISHESVMALIDTRVVLDHCDHVWSVAVHHRFPSNVLQQMADNPNNQYLVAQGKLAQKIGDFCSNRYKRYNSFTEFQVFFEQISTYPLSEQQNPKGVLNGALQQLCEQMPAPVLKEALEFLHNIGWSRSLFWGLCPHKEVLKACYQQNHEYVDLIASFATPQQQAQLFAWVLEGVAWDFFRGFNGKTTLLDRVETILQKPYAQHIPLPIKIATIGPYETYIKTTWDQKNPLCEKHYFSDLQTYFQLTAAHFSSENTFKAVELLKTIDSPSLRGLIDFWGRLHDVDYHITGLKSMTPLQLSSPHSKLDTLLHDKITQVQQYINISGAVDETHSIQSRARKM